MRLVEVHPDNWESMAEEHAHTLVTRKLAMLLTVFCVKSVTPGTTVTLDSDDFVLVDALNNSELNYLITSLVEEKLIVVRGNRAGGRYVVTPQGWERHSKTDSSGVPQPEQKTAIDEALRAPLVPLQNARGLALEFQARSNNPQEPLALVLFDIDHFKQVNDDHGGHAIGNEALISVAQIAAACVKGKGSAYRDGGDEFVLLLPNHTLQEGLAVAERFRSEVNAVPHTSRKLTLSVSVGVAVWPTNGADLAAVQKAADDAMYDAKRRGRDLVRYHGEPEPSVQGPRATERKAPEPGGLTEKEELQIRQDYFRNGTARCPRDEAILAVSDVTAQQDARNSILILCPLCGLSANLS